MLDRAQSLAPLTIMIAVLSLALICVATIIFFSHRLRCYLRHFQAVGYSPKLFKDWMLANGIYDKKGSLIATIAALTIEITKESSVNSLVICTIATVAFVILSFWENDPRKVGHPLLVLTKQVIAIYRIALCLYSIAFVLCVATVYQISADNEIAAHWLLVIIAIQSSPLWLVFASAIYKWRTR